MNIKWLSIISATLLILAIPSFLPYDYYIILRWVITISAIINAVGFNKSKLTGWVLIFSALAILFNPLFPIYLNKSSWVAIDLISTIIFFLSAYSIKKEG